MRRDGLLWHVLCRPQLSDGTGFMLAAIWCLVATFVVSLVAVLVPQGLRAQADASVAEFARLDSADTPYYQQWASSAAPGADPQMLQLHLFNCTNPAAVVAGAAPRLVDVGPFQFQQQFLMHDVSWEEGGDVISFQHWAWLVAASQGEAEQDDDSSGGGGGGGGAPALPLATVIVSLNVPLVVLVAHGYPAMQRLEGDGSEPAPRASRLHRILAGECDGSENENADSLYSGESAAAVAAGELVVDALGCALPPLASAAAGQLRHVLSGAPPTEPLFVSRTAGELLFGYPSWIFLALNAVDRSFPAAYPGLRPNITSLADNRAQSGLSRMYTGKVTVNLARSLITWDAMSSLLCCAAGPCGTAGPAGSEAHPAWAGLDANSVRGSSGLQFKSGVSADFKLDIFVDPFVRTVPLVSAAAATASAAGPAAGASYDGISTLRFVIDKSAFASEAEEPDNDDYYAPATLSGLMNMTSCSMGGAPIFNSKPFFLGGNASLRNATGLPPGVPSLHDSWFDIEPLTGKVLGRHSRTQLNSFVDELVARDGHKLFPDVAPVYLPLFWSDFSLRVSADWAASFARDVQARQALASAVQLACAYSAGALAALALALLVVGRGRRRLFKTEQFDDQISSLMVSHGGGGGGGTINGGSGDRGGARGPGGSPMADNVLNLLLLAGDRSSLNLTLHREASSEVGFFAGELFPKGGAAAGTSPAAGPGPGPEGGATALLLAGGR